MTPDAPPTEDPTPNRPRVRRGLKYALIVTYLAALALVPDWAFLGFRATPMAEDATLEESEAERFRPVSWETLGGFPYEFEVPGALEDASAVALAQRNEQLLPAAVRALDQSSVAVRGYVIPIEIRRGRVTAFILAAKNEIGCCYGDGLAMNQWILVSVPQGEKFPFGEPRLATVMGVLEVGEVVQEGTVMSLYRMNEATVRSG